MRKSDRLFQLTNILRAHQPVTAKELAGKLRVSERTIYRYIDDLSVSGVPVYGEPGVGYRLSRGYDLPPLQLTRQELEALMTGVTMLSSWTGSDFAAISGSLLAKIEAALPDYVRKVSEKQQTIRMPGSHARPIDHAYWDTINLAIESKQWLTIHYNSLQETLSTRAVFPLGLFYWGNKWTLGSWCSLKASYRDFRLDRMEAVIMDGANAALPEAVSLSTYMAYQKEQWGDIND